MKITEVEQAKVEYFMKRARSKHHLLKRKGTNWDSQISKTDGKEESYVPADGFFPHEGYRLKPFCLPTQNSHKRIRLNRVSLVD